MNDHFFKSLLRSAMLAGIVCSSFFSGVAQTRLLGATSSGGSGFGTLFSIIPGAAVLSSQVNLAGNPGGLPFGNRMFEAPNGKFYGLAPLGGTYNAGVLYEYDFTTNVYTIKVNLYYAIGSGAEGSLIMLPNGKLLGTAENGGTQGAGVIFEYDYINDVYTVLKNLVYADGANPMANFVQASNGKFYCVTNFGGSDDLGALIEYDYATNTVTKKIDMTDVTGFNCFFSLVEGVNGKLYGAASQGAANGMGVIFEYDFQNNVYTNKVDMTLANGAGPVAALYLAPNGKFYGSATYGAANDHGGIYEYDYINNIYTLKINFSQSEGTQSQGTLMQATDGKLYGISYQGGTNNGGVIYQYDYLTNTYAKKIDLVFLNGTYGGCALAQASNGKLYGTTFDGGRAALGVIFEYDFVNNTYTKKIDLEYGEQGSNAYGAPMQANNEKVYYLTQRGGAENTGAIIEYDLITNSYTKKVDLVYAGGISPYGSMTQAGNGKLYGLTQNGGSDDGGTLFEYDYITNIYTKKIDLVAGTGKKPYGTMIEAANGKLYGTTTEGGINNRGVLFVYDYNTNIYTKLHDFDVPNGRPGPELIEAANGKLYGATQSGVPGTIFEYDYLTNTFTTKVVMTNINGINITGCFVEPTNGKLFGRTLEGGNNGQGVIFEYDYLSNIYTKKLNLTAANGYSAQGSMIKGENGKLYGLTFNGGTFNKGTLFEYDYLNNIYTKKIDFNELNGTNPYSSLLEVDFSAVPVSLLNFNAVRSGKNALLTWKASHENIGGYTEIERSPDNVSFAYLGRKNVAGNNAAVNNYSFTDSKVLMGTNYYRLKMYGNDGRFRYSEIRMVRFEKDGEVVVYPNPMQTQLNISFPENWIDQHVKFTLFNHLGQQVWYKETDHVKQMESLMVNKQANGSYTLKLEKPKAAAIYKKVQVVN